MDRFSPKLELINHFDNLINRVDIEIEECLAKYNEQQILGDQERIRDERSFKFPLCFHLCFLTSKNTNQIVEKWPKSTKVVDYLSQIRMRTIDELREAQKDSIENVSFKLRNQLIIEGEGKKLDEEIKSQMFGEKFYFQVRYKPKNENNVDEEEEEEESWIFNLYTIVTDFYMSPVDINLLENMINASNDLNLLDSNSDIIFDEKMVLIGLIIERFFENLNNTQELPNHSIRVSRNDLLNVRSISCHYATSAVNLTYSQTYLPLKLERLALHGKVVKIEDFSLLKSLDLKLSSLEEITLRNIPLRELKLELVESQINCDIQVKLFDQLTSVEKLTLIGRFSNFNLDNMLSLEELSLKGSLDKDFNYDLFTNLSDRLTDLSIDCSNIDDESINKLFVDNRFTNLLKLRIMNSKITRLENKTFRLFETLVDLKVNNNETLKSIDSDCFSSLKRLNRLNLTKNSIESLDRRHFWELRNLEYLKLSESKISHLEENMFLNLKKLTTLDLSYCYLGNFNPEMFIGLERLKTLDLRSNELTVFDLRILVNLTQIKMIDLSGNLAINNKEEILNHMKTYSNIEFKFGSLC